MSECLKQGNNKMRSLSNKYTELVFYISSQATVI